MKTKATNEASPAISERIIPEWDEGTTDRQDLLRTPGGFFKVIGRDDREASARARTIVYGTTEAPSKEWDVRVAVTRDVILQLFYLRPLDRVEAWFIARLRMFLMRLQLVQRPLQHLESAPKRWPSWARRLASKFSADRVNSMLRFGYADEGVNFRQAFEDWSPIPFSSFSWGGFFSDEERPLVLSCVPGRVKIPRILPADPPLPMPGWIEDALANFQSHVVRQAVRDCWDAPFRQRGYVDEIDKWLALGVDDIATLARLTGAAAGHIGKHIKGYSTSSNVTDRPDDKVRIALNGADNLFAYAHELSIGDFRSIAARFQSILSDIELRKLRR
ncbi:MAG: hypothetical protein FWD73_15760 [Polyangiaceae bacterium]|nr:hypothetical protein [Polyangiaceae bacterium]